MSFIIGRPINGISLNGLEYVLDAPDGNVMEFESEAKAQEFCLNNGADKQDFSSSIHIIDTNCDGLTN